MKKIAYTILIILFFSACSKQHFFESYVEIPQEIWNQNEVVKFSPEINDVNSLYNIDLSIRHTKDYKYGNLWLFIHIKSPSGKLQIDTVNCILVNDDNSWKGKCSGSVCNYTFAYADSVKFSETGVYTFEIEQGLREENLPMITELGLIIDKIPTNVQK